MAPVEEVPVREKMTADNNIDIKRMISGSTSDVSVSDLSKKGFKKVKVLNQEMIKQLIAKAVDHVLESRTADISAQTRDKVIKESKAQFKELLKEKIDEAKQKSRQSEQALNEREEKISALRKEVTALQEELESRKGELGQMESEAELLAKQKAAHEQELQQYKSELTSKAKELEKYQHELDEKQARCEEQGQALDQYQKQLDEEQAENRRQAEELKRYQKELDGEREDRRHQAEELDKYRKELKEERERLQQQSEEFKQFQAELAGERAQQEKQAAEQSQMGELASVFKELIHEVKGSSKETSEQQMQEFRKSMEVFAEKIAKGMSHGGGGGFNATNEDSLSDVTAALLSMKHSDKLETNISKVGVKENKTKKGVKSSLAKLKSMQNRGG